MKKTFLRILTFMTVFIMLPIVHTYAADVPNFMKTAGGKATYYGTEHGISKFGGEYDVYQYWMSVDDSKRLIEDYVYHLLTNYPFNFLETYDEDYISTSAEFFENGVFAYIGPKNVSSFIKQKYSDKSLHRGHLFITAYNNYIEGQTKLFIIVAQGLTYDDGQYDDYEYKEEKQNPQELEPKMQKDIQIEQKQDNKEHAKISTSNDRPIRYRHILAGIVFCILSLIFCNINLVVGIVIAIAPGFIVENSVVYAVSFGATLIVVIVIGFLLHESESKKSSKNNDTEYKNKKFDLPNILSVNGHDINFIKVSEHIDDEACISYNYDCKLNEGKKILDDYISLLLRDYQFQLMRNEVNDLHEIKQKMYVYNFIYNGTKKIGCVNKDMDNLVIILQEYFEYDKSTIKIIMAKDLEYADVG